MIESRAWPATFNFLVTIKDWIQLSTLGMWAHCSSLFSLSLSLTSSTGIGAVSDLESTLMCGANNAMVSLFTFVFWHSCEDHGLKVQKGDHTSQLSRITQRHLATDLSGG
jgi:hypothetical protein